MTRIVSIGEAMVEMAPNGQAGMFQRGFAGDTMNTAWYLRKLLPETDQVDYLTAVGTDAISEQMLGFLSQAQIGTDCVLRRSDRTIGLYMIQLSNGERSFSYWRGQSAARTLADDPQALAKALTGADIAFFSGITIAILPAPQRAELLQVLKEFRANGGQVVFDPNLRPRLWDSGAQMTEAVMQAAQVSDMVLPSHEDEADWFGDKDTEHTAKRYQNAGARTVIVKNGADAMLALHDGVISHHPSVKAAQVVDTTAAGDSFNAGFLAALQAGQSLDSAIKAGATLAVNVIQARGALIWPVEETLLVS